MFSMCRLIWWQWKSWKCVYVKEKKKNEQTTRRENESFWIELNDKQQSFTILWLDLGISMLVNHNQMMVFMWVSNTKTKLCCCVCLDEIRNGKRHTHTLTHTRYMCSIIHTHTQEKYDPIKRFMQTMHVHVACTHCHCTLYTMNNHILIEYETHTHTLYNVCACVWVCAPFWAIFYIHTYMCVCVSIYLQFRRWYFDVLFLLYYSQRYT